MERQSMTVLFLALGLLLTFTGLLFAEESPVTRKKPLKHIKSVNRAREPRRGDITAPGHTVPRQDMTYGVAMVRRVAVRKLKAANHSRSSYRQNRKKHIVPVSLGLTRMAGRRLEEIDPNSSKEAGEPEVNESSNTAPHTVRAQLVDAARKFLGLPYRWGGMSERRGVDCSGLVKMLFAKLHVALPRSSREQIQSGKEVPMDQLETGDLVFFSSRGQTPTHVGVYVGNNQFLHAATKARQVIISDLNQPWYNKRFLSARRVVDLSKDDESM